MSPPPRCARPPGSLREASEADVTVHPDTHPTTLIEGGPTNGVRSVRRPLVARAVARANSRLIDYDLENYPLPIARVRPEERQEIGRLRECIATVRSADARATDAGSP